MTGEHPKVRGSIIAVALSVLLIAGVVKLILWLPTDVDEHDKAVNVASEVSALGFPPAVPSRSSWPGVRYLEVRAYYSREWSLDPSRPNILDHVDRKDGVLLSAVQERRLISAVTTRIEPHDGIDMWVPQNAFIFYDPLGRAVAEVDISFDAVFVTGPGIPDYPDIVALADLVDDLGLPIGSHGDAEAFRREFGKLKRM